MMQHIKLYRAPGESSGVVPWTAKKRPTSLYPDKPAFAKFGMLSSTWFNEVRIY